MPAPHRDPRLVALVAAGGTGGVLARDLVTRAVGDTDWPVATFAINVAGAFLIGLLLAALRRRGADEGRRRLARLLLATGVLGGFTTYSALALGTVELVRDDRVLAGAAYGLGTVVVGLGAVVLGAALGRRTGTA
jgi:CrcB protein